jgi:hypothetical protein
MTRLAIIAALVAAGPAWAQEGPPSKMTDLPIDCRMIMTFPPSIECPSNLPYDCMTCGTGTPLPFTCVLCITTSPSTFQGSACEPGYTLLWRQDYSAVCAKELEPPK